MLDQIRILRTIATEGRSSPEIPNIEKQLDNSLFNRGSRKASLSEAGHLSLSKTERILRQCLSPAWSNMICRVCKVSFGSLDQARPTTPT